jgi:integrase
MFLSRRKTTRRYYLHYRDEDGRQRSVSTKSTRKSDALKFVKQFERKQLEAERRAVKRVTLAAFTSEYIKHLEASRRSPDTIATYKSGLLQFNRFAGPVELRAVTPKLLERYIVSKQQSSDSTARTHHAILSAAFTVAVRWEYLHASPIKNVPKPATIEQRPLYVRREDFAKLLDAIPSLDYRELVIVATLTGMRLGELLSLRWESVDLERGMIHVVNSADFTTKSKRSRTIPISDTLAGVLSARKERTRSELVFNRNGYKLDRVTVSKTFKRYVRVSGLNSELKFHSLRHSAASWMVQGGVNLYVVQKILGHSSIQITERYSHLSLTSLNDATRALELGGVSEVGVAA